MQGAGEQQVSQGLALDGSLYVVAALAAVAAPLPLGTRQVDLGHPAHLLYSLALLGSLPERGAWIEREGVARGELFLEPQGRRRPRITASSA
jgi:hypothetical protein